MQKQLKPVSDAHKMSY